MNPAGRWPWHPPPHEGEALTSWLHRIAAGFALTPRQLLNEPGGPAVTVDEMARLLDEVNTPPSQCGAQVAASRQAWESAGLPFRAGQYRWHPYESLTWTCQQQMLQATAAAVALIEAGEIPSRGHHGSLFHPASGPPVFAGDRPKPPARDCAYYFLLATQDAEDAIQAARRDRAAARQMFHLCTYSTTDEARIDRVRGLFVELGISLDDASHNSGHTTLCTP